MSQELVTYIVLGSNSRLARLKKFKVDKDEKCIFLCFKDYSSLVETLDNVVADSSGSTILGGMIISTFFTLYVTPTMYLTLAKNSKRIDVVDIELKKQLSKK